MNQANDIDQLRNGGTAGSADPVFYDTLTRFMERHDAPEPAREVVAFRRGLASWDFAGAAVAGSRLMPLAIREHGWITADELRDGMVIAELQLHDVASARHVLDGLRQFSVRPVGDLRSQLLEAYVLMMERLRPAVAHR